MAKRLLIVETEGNCTALAYSALPETEWWVANATDPEQARERVEGEPPDVIACETELPGVSGYDFARTLREAGFVMPIVFCGSDVDMGEVASIAAATAVQYPLEGEPFREALEAAAATSETQTPEQADDPAPEEQSEEDETDSRRVPGQSQFDQAFTRLFGGKSATPEPPPEPEEEEEPAQPPRDILEEDFPELAANAQEEPEAVELEAEEIEPSNLSEAIEPAESDEEPDEEPATEPAEEQFWSTPFEVSDEEQAQAHVDPAIRPDYEDDSADSSEQEPGTPETAAEDSGEVDFWSAPYDLSSEEKPSEEPTRADEPVQLDEGDLFAPEAEPETESEEEPFSPDEPFAQEDAFAADEEPAEDLLASTPVDAPPQTLEAVELDQLSDEERAGLDDEVLELTPASTQEPAPEQDSEPAVSGAPLEEALQNFTTEQGDEDEEPDESDVALAGATLAAAGLAGAALASEALPEELIIEAEPDTDFDDELADTADLEEAFKQFTDETDEIPEAEVAVAEETFQQLDIEADEPADEPAEEEVPDALAAFAAEVMADEPAGEVADEADEDELPDAFAAFAAEVVTEESGEDLSEEPEIDLGPLPELGIETDTGDETLQPLDEAAEETPLAALPTESGEELPGEISEQDEDDEEPASAEELEKAFLAFTTGDDDDDDESPEETESVTEELEPLALAEPLEEFGGEEDFAEPTLEDIPIEMDDLDETDIPVESAAAQADDVAAPAPVDDGSVEPFPEVTFDEEELGVEAVEPQETVEGDEEPFIVEPVAFQPLPEAPAAEEEEAEAEEAPESFDFGVEEADAGGLPPSEPQIEPRTDTETDDFDFAALEEGLTATAAVTAVTATAAVVASTADDDEPESFDFEVEEAQINMSAGSCLRVADDEMAEIDDALAQMEAFEPQRDGDEAPPSNETDAAALLDVDFTSLRASSEHPEVEELTAGGVEQPLILEPEEQTQWDVEEAASTPAVESPEVAATVTAASEQAADEITQQVAGETINPDKLAALIQEAVQKAVWDVVPAMAEKMIQEAIDKTQTEPEEE